MRLEYAGKPECKKQDNQKSCLSLCFELVNLHMQAAIAVNKEFARERFKLLISALLIKLTLSLALYHLTDFFAYYGMRFEPRSFVEVFLSNLALVAMLLGFGVDAKRPSNIVHFVLFFFCYLPVSVQYEMVLTTDALIYWSLTSVFILLPLLNTFFPTNGIASQKVSVKFPAFIFLFLLVFFFLLAMVIAKYGFTSNVSGLLDVYEQRAAFKAESNRWSQYAFAWLGNVLVGFSIIIGLAYKRYLLTFLGLATSMYLFFVGGHKSILFIGFLSVGLYFFFEVFKKGLFSFVLFAVAMLFSLIVSYDLVTNEVSLIDSIVIRRGFLLPSQIFFHYGEFFSKNPLNYFSHNFPFSLLLESPYEDKLPAVIGKHYFAFSEGVYANGSVFADAYANLGFLSFPVLLVILTSYYKFLDLIVVSKSTKIIAPMVFISSLSLVNSGFIVSFITHGIMIAMLVLIMMPPVHFGIRKYFK